MDRMEIKRALEVQRVQREYLTAIQPMCDFISKHLAYVPTGFRVNDGVLEPFWQVSDETQGLFEKVEEHFRQVWGWFQKRYPEMFPEPIPSLLAAWPAIGYASGTGPDCAPLEVECWFSCGSIGCGDNKMSKLKYPDVDGHSDPVGSLNEAMVALQAVYGDKAPQGGNTLWAYVMSAVGEILSRRPLQERREIVERYVKGFYKLRGLGVSLEAKTPEEEEVVKRLLDRVVGETLRYLTKPWTPEVERPMGKPPKPGLLVDARHDRAHKEGTKSRGIRAAKVPKKGTD